MSAIVDGLITALGFANAEAGLVGSANIYGASVGSLCAVFIVRHVRWRPALLALFLLMISIDLASTLIHAPGLLADVRGVHGVIAVYSVMARLHSPDRAFGVLLVLQFGLGGLGVMFLPQLVPQFGARILFMVLAGLTALALVSMLAVPRALAENAKSEITTGTPAGYRRCTVLLSLLALFLFQAGNMALAAFIIRLGEHAHLERGFIGDALGWATWIGTAGAVRYAGESLHESVGFLWSSNPLVFLIANIGTAITWSFVVPYLFGMISRLDASGRLATLGGFVSKCGLASGPLVAGLLLRSDNFDLLIWLSVAVLALSAVAAFLAARQIDQLEVST